ncbi:hypothetical protein TraAM80_05192 [Trypanosoma rangeli]|uniref:Uncharacterized protein n=1 Tax=Trypanosoma rangeli TaxID=5698 RepID=A0A422NG21_TRYRA|nr:uncharacterized protein TraAM80_05192 [Trypanosoma rangeli]RNF04412.1 hypothetical protein TraAM80_05192 [Trypanosoma rangeli]|eukprot:RNF04412.1 hypothetical protein TraAM80_05192 [Trypanosoma rangeli]
MDGPTIKRARKEVTLTRKTESCGEDEKNAASTSYAAASCATVEEAGGDVASECSFASSLASDKETELLAEGEKLSGAALREFLKRNFIDYIEQKTACIPDAEEKDM